MGTGDEKKRRGRTRTMGLTGLTMIFTFLCFLMLFLKTGDPIAAAMAAAMPAAIWILTMVVGGMFPSDRLLLSLTMFLCSLGIVILYRFDSGRGLTQALNFLIGIGCMIVCILFVRYAKKWDFFAPVIMAGSLALLVLPVLFGQETNGAKNWIALGGVSFQPSEVVKLALLCVLAYSLSRRRLIISGLYAASCLIILMLQKDLGTALLYYGVTLIMMYVSTGSLTLVGIGLAGGAGAAVLGYQRFAHVRRRVAIWLDPWSDPAGAGYQIVQGLIAMANGGVWGTGLGLGNASVIPYYYNDFAFSIILNEFGGIFGLLVLGLYLAIVVRGLMIAYRAETVFDTLLAVGCSAQLGLQTFVIVGGNIKLIPLTGVTLPLISYGGTSLLSSLCVIGLLQGVAARVRAGVERDRHLAGLREGGIVR